MADALEALLQEGRTFPPPEPFRKDALDHRRVGLRRGRARLAGLLGHAGARARLDRGVAHDPRVGPAVREVVRRRQAQRRVQLPRPPRRSRSRRPGRVPLGRRARRHARRHLPRAARRDVPRRQRAASRSASRRATASRSTWAWCPRLSAAMLACARIGAPHSVVFGGFTAQSLRDRINDAEAKVLITADGAWRRGAVVALKDIADEARRRDAVDRARARAAPHRERRRDAATAATSGGTTSCRGSRPSARARRWTARTCSTSSTRRAPPASPRASCTRPAATSPRCAYTHKYVFDLQPDTDVYWCTADVGWVTGHSYIVYGPLANRATSVLYEGTPDYPRQGPVLVDRREVQGHDPLHRAHRDPDVHEVGRRVSRHATTCRRCA